MRKIAKYITTVLASSVNRILFFDSFTQAADESDGDDLSIHSPDFGRGFGWINPITNYINTITGDNGTALTTSLAVYDMGSADGKMTADLVMGDAATSRVQLILRYLDPGNYWLVTIGNDNSLGLYERKNNTLTAKDTDTFAPAVGTTYTMTVTMDGSSITVEIGGVTVSYSSTFNRAYTLHGYRIVGPGTTTISTVDNLKLERLQTPANDLTQTASALVDAYIARSGASSGKRAQLISVVKWLMDADLWSSVKHLYIAARGFNADTGATIYDLIAAADGGEDLAQSGCAWPTVEGDGLTKAAAGSLASTNALIPTSGAHSILFGIRYLSTVGETILRQDDATPYQLVVLGANMAGSSYGWEPGDGSQYELDTKSTAFENQALYKDQPISLVSNGSGTIFAYANYSAYSTLSTSHHSNDGVAATPVVPNTAFEMPAGAEFDLTYLVILDTNINGINYQFIQHQIELAIAPRNPSTVNSGFIWLTDQGRKITCSSFSIFYDGQTGKYYLYDKFGYFSTGLYPASLGERGEGSLICYSSPSLKGPWHYEGICLKKNDSTHLTELGVSYPSDAFTSWMKVVYHPTRAKYVMAAKAIGIGASTYKLMLAESDSPTGPFTITYTGGIDSDTNNVGDLGIFADGVDAYVIYNQQSGTPRYLKICALDANWQAPSGSAANIDADLESPGMVKIGSRYWLVCTPLAGYDPTAQAAYYSDAANPMSGWTSVGNPFSDASAWDDQSFWSQCSGLVTTPTGEIIYTGTRQIYHWSAPHSMWKGLARAVMLPVTIAGDTMTIAWDPHWDPAGYE